MKKVIAKIIILNLLFSVSLGWGDSNFGYNSGSGVGFVGGGQWAEFGTSEAKVSSDDDALFKRFAEHISNGTQISEKDRDALNHNGKADKYQNYILSKAMTGNQSFEKIQTKMVEALLTDIQQKELRTIYIKKLKKSKRPPGNSYINNLRKNGKLNNLVNFPNKSLLISYIQNKLYKHKADGKQEKVYNLLKKITGPQFNKKIVSAYKNSKNKMISYSDPSFNGMSPEIVNYYLNGYLDIDKGMSFDEIQKFRSQFVINDFENDAFKKIIDGRNVGDDTIHAIMKHDKKWKYLRDQLQLKNPNNYQSIYEGIRSQVINSECSFRPKTFSPNKELVEDLKKISRMDLKSNPNIKTSCQNKLENFQNLGKDIEKLKILIDSRNSRSRPTVNQSTQDGGSEQFSGGDQGGSNQDFGNQSSNQQGMNQNHEDMITKQNDLASQLSEFMSLGCELQGGNSDVLDFASRFTHTLGATASILSSSTHISLLANTFSAVAKLTANLMKMFKGESVLERGKRKKANLEDRRKYLEQMCIFKSFAYRLDSSLTNDPRLEDIYSKGIGNNSRDIERINKEISCYKKLKQTDEIEVLIGNLQQIDLSSYNQCVDFMTPFYIPNAKVENTSHFYNIYLKDCKVKNKKRPSYCDNYEAIRRGALKKDDVYDYCDESISSGKLKRVFSLIKDKIIKGITGNDSSSVDMALSSLNLNLDRLNKSNENLEISLIQSRGKRFSEDIHTYIETTGNALFSNDKDTSPMIAFFDKSKEDISDLNKRLKNKIKKLTSQNYKKTELCDMAPTAIADLNRIEEQKSYVRNFCNSFQVDTRTPFKSSGLRTHTFMNPSAKNGLNDQCKTFYDKGYHKMGSGKIETIYKFLSTCN